MLCVIMYILDYHSLIRHPIHSYYVYWIVGQSPPPPPSSRKSRLNLLKQIYPDESLMIIRSRQNALLKTGCVLYPMESS